MLGIFQHIDRALERWDRRKYKALHRRKAASVGWLDKMQAAAPLLFSHWRVAASQVG
jgi:RNA-directed DNA polymerase